MRALHNVHVQLVYPIVCDPRARIAYRYSSDRNHSSSDQDDNVPQQQPLLSILEISMPLLVDKPRQKLIHISMGYMIQMIHRLMGGALHGSTVF